MLNRDVIETTMRVAAAAGLLGWWLVNEAPAQAGNCEACVTGWCNDTNPGFGDCLGDGQVCSEAFPCS